MRMTHHAFFRLLPACLILTALTACREAEAPRTHDEIIRADFAEILELQGSPCGEVVKFEGNERLNYLVECKTGDRYRIHVNAEGHVKVQQQTE